MPQCSTCCQDPAQSVDKQQDTGELIVPFFPRQNKVHLFHVFPPQEKNSHLLSLAEDCCSETSASNATDSWVWLSMGLFLSFLIDLKAAWSGTISPSWISDSIDGWTSYNFVSFVASNQVFPQGYNQLVSSFYI